MTMSMKGALVVLVAGVLVLTGGSPGDLPAHPSTIDPGEPTAATVLHGQLLHRSDALAAPTVVEVAGDRLVLADNYADRNVRVLRRSDGAVERSFGRRGRGPREFESVYSIDVEPSGELLIHDLTLQRVTRVDLDADFEGERWVADRSMRLDANATLLVTMWSPDGLLGVGSLPGGRLAHLSPDGRLVRVTGAPPVVPGEVRREVWHRAEQTRLRARPDRARWVVASRFADRLEIYDEEGSLLALGDRPYGFGPEDLRDEDPSAVRLGYIDVASTQDRIYALFSGRTRREGQANYGDRIHVFDWEGDLVDVWQLDARLIALSVTPDGRELYGIRHDPFPAVLQYRLP